MKRIILLSVLALEGMGGISGGILLASAPDGHLMQLPVELMNGVFPDFLIPGIILTCLGLLNLAAFAAVSRKSKMIGFWQDWHWLVLRFGLLLK